MAKYVVTYTVPVFVTVDTETEGVESVSVGDESIELTGVLTDSWDDIDIRGVALHDHEGVRVAQDADEWPAWSFG